ncbi:MAG: pyruvate dehydrogenase (acetyl-transferring), homodimeric type [Planctomycetaceae bacterium]
MATQSRGHGTRRQGKFVAKTTVREVPRATEPLADVQTLTTEIDADELAEWLESLDDVAYRYSPEQVQQLIRTLANRASSHGISLPFQPTTPYINTIPVGAQPKYPGDRLLERRIRSLIRWNAMAMVVRANRNYDGIGGHISTYSSAATLIEVGFNHFFRAANEKQLGDFVYFQGHASPGIYARAYLEGRLSNEQLERFRREAPRETGLSSYPHPWLMPNFWQFPTVSMGLGPIMAIYHARFLRYLHHRGLLDTSQSHVWCFVGDGETDEPESLGALTLASREKLDNLIFVINCNLQRLDGPVRGNGKIIQELEAAFRGAGWNCIKVIWGSDWDPLLAADVDGLLVKRMGETLDGQYQKYTVESGAYIREHFFGASPELLAMVARLSDEELRKLNRGGHDPAKVYAAFDAAVNHHAAPTVILAKTIKGYGLGEAGEGRNVTHKQKQLNEAELHAFRKRFDVPIGEKDIVQAPFYRPSENDAELKYLHERRQALGGFLPARIPTKERLSIPALDAFKDLLTGSGKREAATTMAFGRLLSILLKHPEIGDRIVPIIPDEARTFGLEALFRQCGIYASSGQLYEPVDVGQLMYYREAQDGQVLEEGITEAGAMSSFIAAGTAYAHLATPMIPFFIYYSMFGFQRVGDLIWAAADARTKGFLLGATAGRTTLSGEGLQHQDGHSQLVATTVPNLKSYDPAFAYEVAVIIQDGMRRMYGEGEEIFYYLTLYNETYHMPPMPAGAEEGILKGMYRLPPLEEKSKPGEPRPQLLGSGPIVREAQKAQKILSEKFGFSADVWNVTSYCELQREAEAVRRWNALNPQGEQRQSYLEHLLSGVAGPFIAVSDYVRLVPEQIRSWIPGSYTTLGTDGFGRSDTREVLRRHFEIDAGAIAYAALVALHKEKKFDSKQLVKALKTLEIDPAKLDPATA